MTNFAIVGNGKMASDVLRVLSSHAGAAVKICIGDPKHERPQSKLSELCKKLGVEYQSVRDLSDPILTTKLMQLNLDYIVSANNFLIFKADHLKIPRSGIINFHNGPLPRYGGLNCCSWALLNGEESYGVTWHAVDGGVDSGPIIGQRNFPLTTQDTGVTLMSRCIRIGIDLFRDMIPQLLSAQIEARPQDLAQRTYYGAKDRPFGGYLPWWESASILGRYSRSLDFHPLPNLFFRPRLDIGEAVLFVERMTYEAAPVEEATGVILGVGPDSIAISVEGGQINLTGIFDSKGVELNPAQIEKFDRLTAVRM